MKKWKIVLVVVLASYSISTAHLHYGRVYDLLTPVFPRGGGESECV